MTTQQARNYVRAHDSLYAVSDHVWSRISIIVAQVTVHQVSPNSVLCWQICVNRLRQEGSA